MLIDCLIDWFFPMALPPQAIYAAVNLLIFYSSSTFWTWVSLFITTRCIVPKVTGAIGHDSDGRWSLNPVFPPAAAPHVCISSVCRELPLNVRNGQAGVCWGRKPRGWRNRPKHGAGNGRVSGQKHGYVWMRDSLFYARCQKQLDHVKGPGNTLVQVVSLMCLTSVSLL